MCIGGWAAVWCENNNNQRFNGQIWLEPVQLIVEPNSRIIERNLSLYDFHGGDVVNVTWVARTF